MDSINKNQPEDNFENLEGTEAIEKIKAITKKSASCFFCTDIKTGIAPSARPMTVQKVDDEGAFWFLSPNDSDKNKEIAKDPFVQLLFQGSSYADFLSIYGKATITEDKEMIKELWEPVLKVWFIEGIDDPRISVIKIEPSKGYYWDNKHGNAVAFIKKAAGALIGKTIDDSVEGTVEV